MTALLIIFTILFTVISWKRFDVAYIIFLISLPTYLIRFNLFGSSHLPSTLLELSFGILFAVWIVRYLRTDWKKITTFFASHRLFAAGLVLFFLASISSIFISDQWLISLGQWRAYFLEPILFIIMLIGRGLPFETTAFGLVLSSLSVSIVALLQKISNQFYPPSLFDDQLFGRVTSFFTSPNDVGLYLAPIVPLCLYFVLKKNSDRRLKIISGAAGLLALGAIFFSRSLGAWVALFVGLLAILWIFGRKKIAAGLVCLALLSLLLPPVQSLLQSKDKSSANRVTLWGYSWTFLSRSPENFVMGTGIRQFFRKIQKPYYDDTKMERLIYPHDILLNFWTEIGLFGMIGFIIFFFYAFRKAWSDTHFLIRATLTTALIVLFVHGLVDVPYFKNDLAFLFFALLSLAIVPRKTNA